MTPGAYAYVPLERVVWGEAAADAVPREVGRLGAERVFASDIPALAERAAVHPVVLANPRPVRGAADAAEILDLAR